MVNKIKTSISHKTACQSLLTAKVICLFQCILCFLFIDLSQKSIFTLNGSFVSIAQAEDDASNDELPSQDENSAEDQKKTAAQLIAEARLLFDDDRPLDARTKLLQALKKDPNEYHAHVLLASYYMVHVGHYRLALKYIKQAMSLFEKQNGKPPYKTYKTRAEHSHMIYLLSQARLNLDNYQGALDTLDEFNALGYEGDWYSGSRAWILMKLRRLDEAIKEARAGIFAGAEPGRTLNILGILLSMTGQRQASIEVFKQAISYEMSLGKSGQPATPLNNVGEVFKEIFVEPKAESAWLKATNMPDGCDHVLPTLNLALLHIDDLNYVASKRAMDNFESCVAQFPLRNGEEHRALVEMMRGRIALRTGHSQQAISLLQAALEHRQWFGKIGTSETDLQVALLISLSSALEQHNNRLSFKLFSSFADSIKNKQVMFYNSIASWWYARRARQILIEELSSIEDIYIRNTDSMIEYPTFGEVLSSLPSEALEERIRREQETDDRKESASYYKLYLAENYIEHGRLSQAQELIQQVLSNLRPQYDQAVELKALLLASSLASPGSATYRQTAYRAFALSRPALLNAGLRLPIKLYEKNLSLTETIAKSAFFPENAQQLEYGLESQYKDGNFVLEFFSLDRKTKTITVSGDSPEEALNMLTEEVFTQNLAQ